jgi:hypothetical protein
MVAMAISSSPFSARRRRSSTRCGCRAVHEHDEHARGGDTAIEELRALHIDNAQRTVGEAHSGCRHFATIPDTMRWLIVVGPAGTKDITVA